jgi:phospholipid/cholesterol/gamma-HCH transport system substrate-binding protein
MNDERRELGVKFRVGLFVLVALAVFLATIYALGARARLFEARYVVYADFTEVGGLTEGATVRLAGVQIGRVAGVHLPGEPGGKVRVDLDITRRYADRIRKDSIARIETQGLLGDKVVEITVGTAATPALKAGEVLAARDPTDLGRVLNQGAGAVQDMGALMAELRTSAETLNRSKLIESTSATVDRINRVVDQVEHGRGWAHALLYDEPVALKRLNEAIATTQALLDRLDRGQGAAGVLVSPESTAAGKRFVAAMDRLARMVEAPSGEDGLLPGLLFDPKYKGTLEDLRATAKNLREISDRVAAGRGTLGALVAGSADDGGLGTAVQDLKVAIHNLRSVSQKLSAGEGTLGALVADPTVYERLVTILEGAQRSFLLRSLIRSLGETGTESKDDGARR